MGIGRLCRYVNCRAVHSVRGKGNGLHGYFYALGAGRRAAELVAIGVVGRPVRQ
jgi:hypothetical protein